MLIGARNPMVRPIHGAHSGHHPDALGVGQHAAAAAVPEPTPEAGDDSAAAGVDKQVRMLEGKLRAANDAKDRVQTELTKRTAAAAAAAAVGVAARNEGQPVAPPASVLPFVSIITLSAGQVRWERGAVERAPRCSSRCCAPPPGDTPALPACALHLRGINGHQQCRPTLQLTLSRCCRRARTGGVVGPCSTSLTGIRCSTRCISRIRTSGSSCW